MAFGKRMQERQRLGLSQRTLADLLKVPIATISRIENGHYLPNLGLALKIARELKVSLDWLAGTFDPSKSTPASRELFPDAPPTWRTQRPCRDRPAREGV